MAGTRIKAPRLRHARRRLALAVVVVAALAFAASTSFGAARKAALTPITFRTGIEVDSWDAGFISALEKGYYRQAGLAVNIQPGLGSASNVQLAAAGKADIVHAASGPMILADAKGAKIKMIASFVQEGGSGIATIPSIKTVKQMRGHTFFGLTFDYTTVLLPQFEKTVGISGIKEINSTTSNTIQPLIDHSADMIAAAGWAEVPELKALGVKFNYFSYSAYGLNLIGPGLVVNDAWLATHAAAAKAFVKASARGWAWAQANPTAAAALVKKAYSTTNSKFTVAIEKGFSAFNHTPATVGKPLGWMAASDWTHTESLMKKVGLITSPLPLSSLYQNVLSG